MTGNTGNPYDLNDMQMRFAHEYVSSRDLNATQAAKRAGYEDGGGLSAQASYLLSHPKVSAYIADLRFQQLEKLELKQSDVISEVVKLATSDLTDAAFWTETDFFLRPSDSLPRRVTGAIASVKQTKVVKRIPGGKKKDDEEIITSTMEMKMHDKGSAIDKAMRHLGLYEKDNKQGVEALGDILRANDVGRERARNRRVVESRRIE